MKKHLNVNSIFLAVILGGGGFATREVYKELRSTHDHVLMIEQSLPHLVDRGTFDLIVAEIKARQSATEARLTALEQVQVKPR